MTLDEILEEYGDYRSSNGRIPAIAEIVSEYWLGFGPERPMSFDELSEVERFVDDAQSILEGRLSPTSTTEPCPSGGAYQIVQAIVDRGDEAAVRLLLQELGRSASDERLVGLLGAGPLDDLVHDRMPDMFAVLQDLAQSNSTIKAALAEIWIDDEIEASVAGWLFELRIR